MTKMTGESVHTRESLPDYRAEQAKNCPKGGSRAETRSASPTEGSRDLFLGRSQ
jgi:hypothetical protein